MIVWLYKVVQPRVFRWLPKKEEFVFEIGTHTDGRFQLHRRGGARSLRDAVADILYLRNAEKERTLRFRSHPRFYDDEFTLDFDEKKVFLVNDQTNPTSELPLNGAERSVVCRQILEFIGKSGKIEMLPAGK